MEKIAKKLIPAFFLFVMLTSASFAAALNINSATAEQIAETMTGIGPAKAEAIVKDREANGKFKSVEDVSRVKGIGTATIDKNREKITVK
ncbi:MAG: ComEA family DNA-binding protein [Pseudomonadota bacterium]